MELRYLFTAYLSDGSVIQQTPEDRSTAEPLTRSAFYDVMQREDELVGFRLIETDQEYMFQRSWYVDLIDGHFKFGDITFCPQPVSAPTIVPGGKYKLLYFRDHTATWMGDDTHVYRVGWEYTDPNGKLYTQTIVLD